MECAFEGMLYGAVDDEQYLFKYPLSQKIRTRNGIRLIILLCLGTV